MKKWKVILISVIGFAVILVAGIAAVFHFYAVPRYVEPLLETVAAVLNDTGVQKEISETAQEMADKGMLDSLLVEEYVKSVQKTSEENDKDIEENTAASEPESEENRQSIIEPSGSNSVGAKNVQVVEDGGKTHTYGKKKDEQIPKPDASGDNLTGNLSAGTQRLYDRLKSEVSAKDWARAYEIAAKFDMSRVRSLLSDRAELKKYVQSVLTEDEYSECMGLYLKYAHLLK